MKKLNYFFWIVIIVTFFVGKCSITVMAKTPTKYTKEKAFERIEAMVNNEETAYDGECVSLIRLYIDELWDGISWQYATLNGNDYAKLTNDDHFTFYSFVGDFSNVKSGDILVYATSAYSNFFNYDTGEWWNAGHVDIICDVIDNSNIITYEQNFRGRFVSKQYLNLSDIQSWATLAGVLRPEFKEDTKDLIEESDILDEFNLSKNNNKISGFSILNEPVTREQFITVLYHMDGGSKNEFKQIFDDVTDSTAWYAKAVSWAFTNDISKGVGNNLFGIGQHISREEIATMLYKYAKQKNYKLNYNDASLASYVDASLISDWAVTGMRWAVSNDVMKGKPGKDGQKKYLDPKADATLGEAAKLMANMVANTQPQNIQTGSLGLSEAFNKIDTTKKYHIIPCKFTKKVVNIYTNDIQNDAFDLVNVCLWDGVVYGDEAQFFSFKPYEGSYIIMSMNSDYALNFSPRNANNAIIYSVSKDVEPFKVIKNSDNSYTFILASNEEKALTYDDNNVFIDSYDGGNENQRWYLESE